MNIQIDVCIIISVYQTFQIALINRRYRFLGRLGPLESRGLYHSGSKYVELCTYWHGVPRHGRLMRRYLFVSLTFLGGFPLLVWFFAISLRRIRFLIKFWADSPTRVGTMSPGFTSADVLSAVRILPTTQRLSFPQRWRRSKWRV